MGIDLGDVVAKKPLQLTDLTGQTVAVDAYNTLYQFLAIIRQPDGTPLMDAQGRVTSHLNGLFNRTANLVEAGVLPVYVFDGAPHPLKRATLEARQAVKERAREAYEEALKQGDLAVARTKAQQTSVLTREMVEQAKRLLGLLGLPFVEAPMDGEAQASSMVQHGLAHAVASQDYDVILFGAPRLVRNLSVTGRRKVAGKSAWTEVSPELVELGPTLEGVRLTREQLVDAALLMGTDYNPGISGIGPKTALELLREHRSLEALLEASEEGTSAALRKVRQGQEGLGSFEAIRELFLNPPVVPVAPPKAGRLDEEGVKRMLVDDFRFSPERVESGLVKYRGARNQRQQKTLF